MKKILNEFKEFAVKGNVLDLAIGVIIGSAFGKIVSSIVADIFTPIISVLIGGLNFSTLSITIKPEYVDSTGKVIAATTLNYGNFLQNTIDFLIVAWAIFLVVKAINTFKRRSEKEEQKKVEKKLSKQEELLTEIRDLLKTKKSI